MGEKCRTAFLKLYFSGAHLLVLDEPSNYLDVDTREVIEQVLVSFPGAIALVSHDRYLVRKIANRLLTLTPGKIRFGSREVWTRRKSRPRGPA